MKTYTITKYQARHETAWERVIIAVAVLSILLIGFWSFYPETKPPTASQKFVFIGLLLLIFYETWQAGWYKRRKPIKTNAFQAGKEKVFLLFGLTLSIMALLVAVISLASGTLEVVVVTTCLVGIFFGLILILAGLWNIEGKEAGRR